MMSRNFLAFLDPLPPFVTHSRNLSVAFVTYWVTPLSPPSVRTSFKYRPLDSKDKNNKLQRTLGTIVLILASYLLTYTTEILHEAFTPHCGMWRNVSVQMRL